LIRQKHSTGKSNVANTNPRSTMTDTQPNDTNDPIVEPETESEEEEAPELWSAGQVMEIDQTEAATVIPSAAPNPAARTWCLEERSQVETFIHKAEGDLHYGIMKYLVLSHAAGLDLNNPEDVPPHYRGLIAHHGNPNDGEGHFRRPDMINGRGLGNIYGFPTTTPEATEAYLREQCAEIRQKVGEYDRQRLQAVAKARLNGVAKRVLELSDVEPGDQVVSAEEAENACNMYSRYVKQQKLLPDEILPRLYFDEM
jgi:hypothetical protein